MTADTDADAAFLSPRPRLFDVAYRMTGSVADADDLCQEAWLRWQRAPRDHVDTPEAWLVRTITNLAIDRARSAQARREHYVGPYLPEPLVTGALGDPPAAAASGDPERRAELADSLTFAFLVMLDALDPPRAPCCYCTTCSASISTKWPTRSASRRPRAARSRAAPGASCTARRPRRPPAIGAPRSRRSRRCSACS